MTFDYRREMLDALSDVPNATFDQLVWIMNEAHRAKYRKFLEGEMGVEPDDREAFGIPIETGEPTNSQAFELCVKPRH